MLPRVLVFSLVGVSGVVAEDGRGEVPRVYAAADVLALQGECTAPAVDAGYNNTDCVGKVENETCSIACAAGWTIDGALGLYTCQANQTFTGELPTCNANECTALNLDAEYNSTDCVGKVTVETCTISCAAGYEGNTTSNTCQPSGVVSDARPTCTANECTALILDAKYDVTNCVGKVTAETCSIACATGWTIDGALGSYTCDSGGSFAGTPPTCTANECTALNSGDQYDDTDCNGKTTAQTCSIACAAGWTIAGSPGSQTCQANKTFTGDLPNCTANTCNALNSDAKYDDTDCNGKTTAQTCSIACAAGWTIAGSPGSQTCQANKNFTGDLPNCTAKDSGALPSAPLAGMLVALCLHVGSAFA